MLDTALFSDIVAVPGNEPLLAVSQFPPLVVATFVVKAPDELLDVPTATLCAAAVPPAPMLKVRVEGVAVNEGMFETTKVTGIITAGVPRDLRTLGAAPLVVIAIAPV